MNLVSEFFSAVLGVLAAFFVAYIVVCIVAWLRRGAA